MIELLKDVMLSDKLETKFISDVSNLDLTITFKVIMGEFSFTQKSWMRIYKKENVIEKFIVLDDIDGETKDFMIGSIPIDSILNFKKTLRDAGLTQLANKFEVTDTEIDILLFKEIRNCQSVKKFFGEFEIWNCLSHDERLKHELNFLIENYDTLSKEFIQSKYRSYCPMDKEIKTVTKDILIDLLNSPNG